MVTVQYSYIFLLHTCQSQGSQLMSLLHKGWPLVITSSPAQLLSFSAQQHGDTELGHWSHLYHCYLSLSSHEPVYIYYSFIRRWWITQNNTSSQLYCYYLFCTMNEVYNIAFIEVILIASWLWWSYGAGLLLCWGFYIWKLMLCIIVYLTNYLIISFHSLLNHM